MLRWGEEKILSFTNKNEAEPLKKSTKIRYKIEGRISRIRSDLFNALRKLGRSKTFYLSLLVSVGSYQFFTVLALTFFGVDKVQAAGFSMVAFVLLTAPLWLIGFVALRSSHFELSVMRQDIRKLLN